MANPTISSLGPDKGEVGKEYYVDIFGTDFKNGCKVTFDTNYTKITVVNVDFRHTGQLTVHIDIARDAEKKKYKVTVKNNSSAGSKEDAFEVVAPEVLDH
jgi:hypothetical protein